MNHCRDCIYFRNGEPYGECNNGRFTYGDDFRKIDNEPPKLLRLGPSWTFTLTLDVYYGSLKNER